MNIWAKDESERQLVYFKIVVDIFLVVIQNNLTGGHYKT